jgi:intracellular multiplication protein IcmD
MKFRSMMKNRWMKSSLLFAASALSFFTGSVFADTAGLGQIAQTVTNSFEQFGQLMIAVSYLAGIGFSIAAIFKFKQHKDNPTQIPLGTPLALMAVGIILIFIPSFITPAGKTLFGDQQTTAGGFEGQAAKDLPGNT